MITKRILCAVLIILVSAAGAFASDESAGVRVGVLRYLGTTEEVFQQSIDELNTAMRAAMMGVSSRKQASEMLQKLKIFVDKHYVIKFFDSLTAMLMAVNAGRIQEFSLPEFTARYVMKNNPEYKLMFTLRMPSAISFGFRENSTALRDEFNSAIESMNADGTLQSLAEKYIGSDNDFQTEAVGFVKIHDADTIKVAVTGDMPPVDYVNEAGMAAGYNTAVIAEIGKRLKKNIEILSIEAGARSEALTSGRADVIFWYRTTQGLKFHEEIDVDDSQINKVLTDTTEGVILSEPYYRWENELFLAK